MADLPVVVVARPTEKGHQNAEVVLTSEVTVENGTAINAHLRELGYTPDNCVLQSKGRQSRLDLAALASHYTEWEIPEVWGR